MAAEEMEAEGTAGEQMVEAEEGGRAPSFFFFLAAPRAYRVEGARPLLLPLLGMMTLAMSFGMSTSIDFVDSREMGRHVARMVGGPQSVTKLKS